MLWCNLITIHKSEILFIQQTEKYYLRALGEDPRKDVANISVHFPKLAQEISIPDFFEPSQFFSSVFRIASKGTQIWTHYDVRKLIHIFLIIVYSMSVKMDQKVATFFASKAYLRCPQLVGGLTINHLSGRLQSCVPHVWQCTGVKFNMGIFTCFCIATNLASLTPSISNIWFS